jgi:integrase/recombinase XerD
MKRLAKVREDMEHHRFHGASRLSYKHAVLEWSEAHFPTLKPKTVKRYQQSLRQLDPHFSDLFMDQIGRKQVAEYVRKRQKEGVTNATIRRDLNVLSRICAFGVNSDALAANPVRDFDKSLIPERRDPIALPDEASIGMVMDRIPRSRLASLCRFLLRTGLRRDEGVFLEWSRISPDRAQVHLQDTKGRTVRVLTMNDEARAILAAQPRHIASQYVFWHHEGEPLRHTSRQFRDAVKAAQKSAQENSEDFRPFRLHDLRHRFAVDFLRNGGSIYDLQQVLGHRSITTTEIYLQYLTLDEQKIAKHTPAQNLAQTHRFAR